MSTFAVEVRSIEVHPHENADALEIGKIADYQAVVGKGTFSTGDMAVYIPEQAVVPDKIIEEMGLTGRLAGPAHNRVKAVRLRGIVSQGLFYRPAVWPAHWKLGTDVAQELGIVKYEAPIPAHLAGEVYPCNEVSNYTDIENIKGYPDVLVEGEEVVATEKLHGTCTIISYENGEMHVTSKGMAKKNLALKDTLDADGRSLNAYWRAAHSVNARSALEAITRSLSAQNVTLYGETVGVQDLMYGHNKGTVGFAAFDLKINGEYISYDEMARTLAAHNIPLVPLIYRGPYSASTLREVATGKEQFTGSETHIREGVVVRPVEERSDMGMGRVVLKVVSDAYLLRKGEATEFE